MKFAVYQMHITSSKNINEEEHKQFKNEEFEDFDRVFLVLLYTFFEDFFDEMAFFKINDQNVEFRHFFPYNCRI